MAVFAKPGNTYLTSSVGGLAFDTTGSSPYPDVEIAGAAAISAANASCYILHTASDYIANTGAPILVGVNATVAGDDGIYLVSGRNSGSGGGSALSKSTSSQMVDSLIVAGPLATATAYYGLAGQGTSNVYWSNTFNSSSVTWNGASKVPTGSGTVNTYVAAAGGFIYALDGGTGATLNCALSRSPDAGADFNQLSLIDVGNVANMALVSMAVVDTNTMFVIMHNGTGGYLNNSVFETVNGGTSWQRIWLGDTFLSLVSASPAYNTDATVVLADTNSMIIEKSTNGGTSFTAWGVVAKPSALLTTTGGVYYTGAASAFYKFRSLRRRDRYYRHRRLHCG